MNHLATQFSYVFFPLDNDDSVTPALALTVARFSDGSEAGLRLGTCTPLASANKRCLAVSLRGGI